MVLTQFTELLSQKVTRKQFLMHMGLLILAISGISGLLKTLSDPHLISKKPRSAHGYGGGTYAG